MARAAPPAQVSGLWCGEGLLREVRLELAQHQQQFDGTLGGHLRILTAGGPLALAQGMGFRRAAGEHCS